MKKSTEILAHYWGYNQFRPMQSEIVDSAIYGHDTLALLPTGGGKSICYQVPGLAREGLTLVISPLIALMQDQVKNLQSKGIRAQAIFSGLSYREIDILLDNAAYGGLDFLYVSPERIQTRLFLERFKKMQVGLLVVDEAHCISEWGHDFRPAYAQIGELRELKPDLPIIAVTATATSAVQEDIIEKLKLKNPQSFVGNFERSNLQYGVVRTENKAQMIVDKILAHPNETGIVYCQTRRSVKEIARILHARQIPVGIYHGGMKQEDRSYMLNAWMRNEVLVMVSTNAFGMGIDKPDVRFVFHYEVPNNLEAYYQEAGRAGRDEKPAIAVAYYSENDLNKMEQNVIRSFPTLEEISLVFRALCNHLQLAIGSGKDETYPFNLGYLSKHFNLSNTLIYNCLKALEVNGNLLFSEGVFSPTKLKFAIGNKELYSFQIKQEKVSSLISLLSRSYPGIFQLFFEINEAEFCKRLEVSSKELENQLKFLEKMGVIDISWRSSEPKVTFLEERKHGDQLFIQPKAYLDRKTKALRRLASVQNYLTATECRNTMLLDYFNQPSKKCGHCDICLLEKKRIELPQLKKELIVLLQSPKFLQEVLSLTGQAKEMVEKALHELLLDEKIREENDLYSAI